jgi:hypothetical protein
MSTLLTEAEREALSSGECPAAGWLTIEMFGLSDAILEQWQKPQAKARPMFAQAGRIMSRLSQLFKAIERVIP